MLGILTVFMVVLDDLIKEVWESVVRVMATSVKTNTRVDVLGS